MLNTQDYFLCNPFRWRCDKEVTIHVIGYNQKILLIIQ